MISAGLQQLQSKYANLLQQGNFDTIEDLFAEKFVLDLGVTGSSQ
jgi:hypothetical protein